jgi:hypothetical protein
VIERTLLDQLGIAGRHGVKNPFEKMGLTSGDNQRETPHAGYEQLTTFPAKAVDMGYPSLATAALTRRVGTPRSKCCQNTPSAPPTGAPEAAASSRQATDA